MSFANENKQIEQSLRESQILVPVIPSQNLKESLTGSSILVPVNLPQYQYENHNKENAFPKENEYNEKPIEKNSVKIENNDKRINQRSNNNYEYKPITDEKILDDEEETKVIRSSDSFNVYNPNKIENENDDMRLNYKMLKIQNSVGKNSPVKKEAKDPAVLSEKVLFQTKKININQYFEIQKRMMLVNEGIKYCQEEGIENHDLDRELIHFKQCIQTLLNGENIIIEQANRGLTPKMLFGLGQEEMNESNNKKGFNKL